MHRLSIVQALGLWTDLEDAYRGTHAYGSDVAEIYVYRFMSRSPLVEKHLSAALQTSIGKSETDRALRDANGSFHNLLLHFAKERNAIVEVQTFIDGSAKFVEVGDWLLQEWGEAHRWHVRVRPRK